MSTMNYEQSRKSSARGSNGTTIGITITRFIRQRNFLSSPRQLCFTLFVSVVLFQSLIILTKKGELSPCSIPVQAVIEQRVIPEILPEKVEVEQKKLNLCKDVHVAMLVWDQSEAREAADCLKTLFHHHTHPIKLHLIVTPITRKILATLFSTWETVQVQMSFYVSDYKETEALQWKVERFAILKYIAPVNESIIYLDNSVRLLDDISTLMTSDSVQHSHISMALDPECTRENSWSMVSIFKKDSKYTKLSCQLPPIIIYNLKEMSASLSTNQLLETLRSNIRVEELLATMSKRLDQFTLIPCNWHVPLRENVEFASCTMGMEVKGVLWETFGNTFSNNVFIEDLKETVRSITLSAPVITQALKCSHSKDSASETAIDYYASISNDSCSMYKYILGFKRRTHLYFLGDTWQESIQNETMENPYEVTLLVQTSLDRFPVLERVLQNWNGPAIVVFHVSDEEAATITKRVRLSKVMSIKRRVAYHVVYKRRGFNAINYLRNVAANNTNTPFTFTLDVDLVPNPGLYESIKKNLAQQVHPSTELLTVPAFQAVMDPGQNMPINKEQLIPMLIKEQIVGYGMKRSWNFGHRPTNYKYWKRATSPYLVTYKDYFEPYVVVPTFTAPKYHEGLLERMGDKIAYARLLHVQGYTFRVLNSDFIIHVPHAISPDKMRETFDKHFEKCMIQFMENDKNDLRRRYPKRTL